LSQEYEIRTEENALYATFSTDEYYAEVPIWETDSEETIQSKIGKAKRAFEFEKPNTA